MTSNSLNLAVVGHPIAHSLSPPLWAKLFSHVGMSGTMHAVDVRPEELPAFCDEVRQGRYDGLCITLPHKEKILALADSVDTGAQRAGAANCLVQSEGTLQAFNTDVAGVGRALKRSQLLAERPPQAAMILGAGGAARAAVVALVERGVTDITICNRTLKRAQTLAASFPGHNVRALSLTDGEVAQRAARARLVINATSVGLQSPAEDPLPSQVALHQHHVVMDMVYRPRATALLKRAAACAAEPLGGLWMLAGQALAAFSHFTNKEAPADALDVLHAYLVETVSPSARLDDDLDFLSARSLIDRTDTSIVELLGRRFEAAKVIGDIKARSGEPVVRPERETALRGRLKTLAHQHGLPDGLIEALYEPVLIASRAAQDALRSSPSKDP